MRCVRVGLVGLCVLVFADAFVEGPSLAQVKQPPKLPEGVELVSDVEYGKGGDRPLKMHLIKPKAAAEKPMPVLVWIHGGGWQGGSKDSGIGLLAPYAAKGCFCATIEYRLSKEAKWPAQIEDCKCAIRFLRSKAKDYNLDADRIGVWGASAGGHLVAMLGTTAHVKELEGKGGWPNFSSKVQAVCVFCGPSELISLSQNSKGADGPITGLLGGAAADNPEKAKQASPVTHVTKDAPPFLLVHGDKDELVPPQQAELLHQALKKAGVDSTLYIAKDRGHGLAGPDIVERVSGFFGKHLLGKNPS
jgi:acetyl esterase/lipase